MTKLNPSADDSTSKVFDVSKPGKTAAPPASKSIIVTNRPLLKDPMVLDEQPEKDAVLPDKVDNEPAKPVSRVGNVIKVDVPETKEKTPAGQLADEGDTPDAAAATPPPKDDTASVESGTPVSEKPEPPTDSAPSPDKPDASEVKTETKTEESQPDDEPADTTEQEAKDAAAEAEAKKAAERQAELEQLIESKKYALPIDTIQRRKSSKTAVVTICILLALVILVDVALDTGTWKPPFNVPHTHLLGTK